ncbi:hypothetical protein ELI_2785 [Eubacterium callanderi]|uniref:Uncharacterized protein n=1 Tax=Eubacterium callanderi TaxID=53442 RepID=E3GET6_9FIRM|nr:hypothetical protein ELI_2785 [Eubacterium callanderi]
MDLYQSNSRSPPLLDYKNKSSLDVTPRAFIFSFKAKMNKIPLAFITVEEF